jgi:hypothetical protein
MDVLIRLPHDVAHTQLGRTKLLTLLKQMGAQVVEEQTSQNDDVHASSDIQEVFDYHQSVLGDQFPRGLKLTADRRRIIRARLRRFSVVELKQCIDFVAKSPFHLGKNDANKKYLDFDHIMSNDTKVERKLDGMVENQQVYESLPEIRLTLRRLAARMRSGIATLEDKTQFSALHTELASFGERYSWKDDTFTRGE